MKLIAAAALLLLLVLSELTLFGLICAQESDAWIAEPWNSDTALTGENAGTLPDLMLLNITGNEPQYILLAGSKIDFTGYIRENRSNELWVEENSTWAPYLQAQQGEAIELIAYTPTGGSADLYRIYYSSGNISHRGYELLPGYYNLSMLAGTPGRTMLVFAVNNQPANAIIIDVMEAKGKTASGPVPVEGALPVKAKITIKSERVKGYDIYVDGAFYSSDIADGNLDGIANFTVWQGTHTIIISNRDSLGRATYKSEHKRDFKGGYAYTLST